MHIHRQRHSLRNATEHLHRELDETVSQLDLTRRHHYQAFLEASAAPLLAVEGLLEAAGVAQLMEDWPLRSRSARIRADLACLAATVKPLQLQRPLPSRAEMFGMLYVLEGSRRGAQALLKRVGQAADPTIREASSYLQASDPALWSSFLERLEDVGTAEDPAAATSGAIFTFALFQRSFATTQRRMRI